jgi:glycosyltransferase involved in cell wall biosynthesis
MEKKIKVLVITHTFPTKYNPVAAIFLLNQLKSLEKFCDIRVIFPYAYVPNIKFLNPYYRFSKIPEYEKVHGIDVFHPKYIMIPRILFKLRLLNYYLAIESLFSYLSAKKTVKNFLNEWNPDIIHLHGSLSESLLVNWIKKGFKKPLLVTVYGEDVTRYSKQFPSSLLVKNTFKNADAIISQSEFLKKEIGRLGIKNKRFFIIPMGALIEKFKPKGKNIARARLNLPQDKKIILFVGHLFARKGVEYLIKALKQVSKKEKKVLCCIIGSGHLELQLKKLASDLGLNQNVKFLGQKKHSQIPQFMNACDIFVLPSLNEGLPVVLCEALACGKPVVATNVAGTPELVNIDVGLLVKPKDPDDLARKLILALNKKWESKKLLKRAQDFTVDKSAKKLLKVYRSYIK